MNAFVALVTADGYKRMLSTVESDPKVLIELRYDHPPLLPMCSTGVKLIPFHSWSQTSRSVTTIDRLQELHSSLCMYLRRFCAQRDRLGS